MNLRSAVSLVVVSLAFSTAAGCLNEQAGPAPQPALTPAAASGTLTTDQAAAVIAEASCEQQARCNGIGPSSRFVNRDHCLGVMRADAYGSLGLCRQGVKDRELRACVNEINFSACGGPAAPLGWFRRGLMCRAANLCGS
jgi:hypothetical protein